MNYIILAGMPAAPASVHTQLILIPNAAYLIVPGISSSRIHIIDTKPDPRQLKIVKVIEPEELAQRAGYSAPHTVHCGPEGVLISALGAPDGGAPGGVFVMDPETFEILGPGNWIADRRS